ncbi:RAMP superfamily CRISPR-associated protein [Thermodesulfovibrio sp. 3907-1M]|uniref:RAMP superfamily CRISPR-associated protein n=1 Tax=Thermodesulfovibrio autotrophicus TaxID=3118333 RepID=A0AAU8GXS1_9BACT
MQAIRYRITALSPLIFSSNTGDPNMVATLDYIPGSHLRGLFANEFIEKNKLNAVAESDERFFKWFIKGEIKFLNAYIASRDYQNEFQIHYPVPLSIQREKHDDSKIYDLLLTEIEDEEIQTKPFDGNYCRLKESSIYLESLNKSINFHHSRDRHTGVAKQGIIFNYESIDEGQVFEGFILSSAENLLEFKKSFPQGVYYLGRSKSNQYGKVRFEILSDEPFEFYSEIKDSDIKAGEAVLTLLSDTIIYNENGFPVVDIKEFERAIGCPVKKAFIRAKEWEGFISVWRLKTPLEICFTAGSAFIIDVKEDDIPRLRQLQKKGIGMLTHLGFGRFVIGWQESEKYYIAQKDKKYSKPVSTPPQALKSIISSLAEEFLIANTQKIAIRKASEFEKNIPPKSLLSKLEKAVTEDKLTELLKNLKTTAKNHLTKCKTSEQTLYDFLVDFLKKDNHEELKNLLNEHNFNRILRDFELFDINNSDILTKLKKTYLSTLLSVLRKMQNRR